MTGRRRRVSRTVKGTRGRGGADVGPAQGGRPSKAAPLGRHQCQICRGRPGQVHRGRQQRIAGTDSEDGHHDPLGRQAYEGNGAPGWSQVGAIRLSRLTWQDIEHLYAAMRASGRGPDWIRRCATVLTRALELARKRGLIDSNPARDAVRPKSTRKKPFAPLEADVRLSSRA